MSPPVTLLHYCSPPNFSVDSVQLAAWGTAEVGVTIMAASIPILRALFRPGSSRGVPNMNYGEDATGVTAAQRRGAAAAEAAAQATNAPLPTAAPAASETKRWPLLTPKSVRFPSVYRISSVSHEYTKEDAEYDDDDDLKKPGATRSSARSYFKPPRSSL